MKIHGKSRANAALAKLRHFVNFKIYLFCYIAFSFELCMYSLATYNISATKSVYSPKKKALM